MMILRSILCPVDFSEQSREALRWANALAQRHKSRLIVLSAVDPLLAEAAKMRFGLDLAVSEIEPALREFVATTLPDGMERPDPLAFVVTVGNPSDVILKVAARESVDVLVMGTHGLAGVRKWLLGSTTERVLRRTHIPVLAVPSAIIESDTSHADTGPLDLRQILAATDFSDASSRAIHWASEFAQGIGVPLLLAHVVEPIAVAPQWQSYIDEADETRIADARGRLERLIRESFGSTACEIVVSLGRPAESIAALAEERQAGLIVMGLASSRGALAPRPGSIAYRVLCLAKVPVLVVPPAESIDRDRIEN